MGEVGCLKDKHFQNLQVENAVIESLGYKLSVVRIITTTYAPTVLQSGTVFSTDDLAGCTISLPSAEAGLVYEFHVGRTPTSGTIQINAAAADTFQGITDIAPVEGLAVSGGVENQAWAVIPATDNRFSTGNADSAGRLLGTHLVFKCLSNAIWMVTGNQISSGAVTEPFTNV
jgi:hypothetical protein